MQQILMQSAGTLVSKSTLLEALNIDPDKERKRLVREQISDHDMQKEVEAEIRKREENAAAQAQAQEQAATTGEPTPYNQQKMIAMAQQTAMELMQYPYEQRKSMMNELQNEDYVMWALVSKQLEMLHKQEGDVPPDQQGADQQPGM